jgi:hypothetical protein
MPLRQGEEDEAGISFYHVGTEEEFARADEVIGELTAQTIEAAERLARERNVQLAELLHDTGDRLTERAIELLRAEPAWKLSRRQLREIREGAIDDSASELADDESSGSSDSKS